MHALVLNFPHLAQALLFFSPLTDNHVTQTVPSPRGESDECYTTLILGHYK